MKILRSGVGAILFLILLVGNIYAACDKEHKEESCDRAKAEQGKEERRREQGGDIDHLLQSPELELAQEQREKLKAVQGEFEKSAVLIRAELKVKRMELEELLKADAVDKGKIEAAVKGISDLNGRLLLEGTMTRLKVREVLTSEQLGKARALIEKRREK